MPALFECRVPSHIPDPLNCDTGPKYADDANIVRGLVVTKWKWERFETKEDWRTLADGKFVFTENIRGKHPVMDH